MFRRLQNLPSYLGYAGSSPRNNHPQNALDLAVGTAISAANMLVAIGRIVVNCVAQVAYVLAYIIVTLANLVIRFAVLTARGRRPPSHLWQD